MMINKNDGNVFECDHSTETYLALLGQSITFIHADIKRIEKMIENINKKIDSMK